MSDRELANAAIKLQHKLYECQRHNMKLRTLLDECERVLSSIYTDAVQYTYPTCKRTVLKCEATLAKIRGQDKVAQEKADEQKLSR